MWGLGIEKEFPIFVGKFQISELTSANNMCTQYFQKKFIENTDSNISKDLMKKWVNLLQKINSNMTKSISELSNDEFYLKINEIIYEKDVADDIYI